MPTPETPKDEQPVVDQTTGDNDISDAIVNASEQNNNTTNNSGDTIPTFKEDDEVLNYLIEARDANRRLTSDDIKKLRRKQRTEEIISGIGDAVRSLSNLYFTSQYAPNMYDHTKGMSEATKARWDKTWKEREAENDRFLNYALKIHDIQSKSAATQYQQTRDKSQDELKEREMTRKEAWDAWRMEDGRLSNGIEAKKLEIAQATGEAKIKAQNELAEMYRARAELYNRTPMMGGSGGGKPAEYPWYDKDGKLHYSRSYEAMRQNAIQHGTWEEATQTSTTTKNGGGLGSQTSTTTKPGKGHSTKPNTGKKHADL